MNLGQKLGERF